MIDLIKQEISKNGDKSMIISTQCLQNLKQDIEELKKNNSLNTYIKKVINNYDFELPKLSFEIHSIIIVASPSPFVKVKFNLKGKKIYLTIPPSYIDMSSKPVTIEKYLNAFLNPAGYHAKYTESLPQKLLAVRSGLGVYGRNNICYVEGMGSFLKIATYYSDVPCEKSNWHELRQTDLCRSCKACMYRCPTKAITSESHLIKADRCLTHFNEHSVEEFPSWIDPSSHNCIVGCLECQSCCPNNKEHMNNIIEPIEFTEEETLLLIDGKPLELYPDTLTEKIKILGIFDYLDALPRNLRALMNRSEYITTDTKN